MTSDRLDRIDLLLYQVSRELSSSTEDKLYRILEIMAAEIRYLHGRSLSDQAIDHAVAKENTQ